MKKIFTLIAVAAMALTASAQTKYSWESPEGTAVETGGKATYKSGPDGADRVNYANANYYTLSINGKKANMGTEASANGGYIQIDLNSELAAGDVIVLTGYLNKNEAGKEASLYFAFEKGDGVDDSYIYGDADNIDEAVGGKITTHNFTVPEGNAGSKFFQMSRSKASTNIFLTKLEVTGTAGISTLQDLKAVDGTAYNLAGQQVEKSYKGIVIVNGKKMIQK